MNTIITAPEAEADGLRALRQRRGLTQRQLSRLAGCSLTTVANIEAGCIPRRSQVLARLFAVLDDEHPAGRPGVVRPSRGGDARRVES